MHRGRILPLGLGAALAAFAVLLALAPLAGRRIPLVGTVSDARGPVELSRVRFKGDLFSTLTDDRGQFDLSAAFPRTGRITASREGYFIAGADAGGGVVDLRLRLLPSQDCERYEWVDPTPDPGRPHNCGNCHEEIYREWLGSGHARAATGQRFLNLYDGSDWHGRPGRGWSLLDEHPDGAGVCASCHAPSQEGLSFDVREARGVAARGVHCDYCHKVSGTAGEYGVTHGRFGLKLLRPAEGQLFFGPLDDVDRGEDAYLPVYTRSRYCAPCHEGKVFGVHVYSTYSEWQASPARRKGQECQSCHTAPTGRMTNIAPGHGGIERDPRTLGNHRFFKGSVEEMLRDSLRLDLRARRTSDGVDVEVVVEATNVGHRVPTGFVDRHVVLVVEAFTADEKDQPAAAGPRLPDAAGGGLRGKAGKLYAKLLKDFDGRSPAPFWRADPEADDTRLSPSAPDRLHFQFPESAVRLRGRLLYRRFWAEVAASKGWPDNEILVAER
jgi:hypothetical protein